MNQPLDLLMTQKLEQLRTRLLDLSLANRLLNFKHPPQGRHFLRIIDDTPNLLWSRLINKSLIFRSLPTIDEEPEQQRMRKALELPSPLSPSLTLAEHAKQQGIHPSFDLPTDDPTQLIAQREYIQLLLTPPLAEKQLLYVREAANQRLEETGINMLFCTFGFLEWYETPASSTPLHAPLLFLPVTLKRELKHHQFTYTLSITDEDPFHNLTLKEKLLQSFGIALPEWRETDDPETYWQHIREAIQNQERWQIRRWVTIGIFPFSRMAMYEDLNPNHPQLLNHPQTRELLLGREASAGKEAPTHQVEKKEFLPPLTVSTMDASQYTAVCQAMQSPSVVIKGPPGTGKSQTITNLIAAALARGENILFVADKQAALNVVFSRLKEVGLADFCLELHSHQTTRTSVLQSLKKRLEMPLLKHSDQLEQKLKEMEETHQAVDQYTHFLAQPLGQSQMTIRDILWAARETSDKLPKSPSRLLKSYFNHPEEIHPASIQKAKKLLKAVENAYHVTIGEGSFHDHPWKGIGKTGFSPFQMEELQDLLHPMTQKFRHLQSCCQTFADRHGIHLESLEQGEQFNDQLSQVLHYMKNIETRALPQCASQEWRSKSEQLIQTIEQLRSSSQLLQLDLSLLSSFPLALFERIETLCQSLPFAVISMARLDQEIEQVNRQIDCLHRLHLFSQELIQAFGLKEDLSLEALKSLWSAISHLAHTPPSLLKWRYPPLYDESTDHLLQEAQQEAQQLQEFTQRLSRRFRIQELDLTMDLTLYAKPLEHHRWWRFLKRSFRVARRFYQSISLQPLKEPAAMAADLHELNRYVKTRLTFEQNPAIHQRCGPHFMGLETDFTSLAEAAQFGLDVHRHFMGSNRIQQAIRSTLLEGQESILHNLAAYIKHPMAFAFSGLLASSADSPEWTMNRFIESWTSYQKKLNELKICVEKGCALLPSFKLEAFSQWMTMGRSIQQILKRLEDLREVALTWDPQFSPETIPLHSIQETLAYWEYVHRHQQLAPLASQLLSPSAKTLQEPLQTFSHSLQQQMAKIQLQWETIRQVGGIDEEWFFANHQPLTQQSWDSILSRLERCIQSPEQLASWSILSETLASAKQEGLDLIYQPLLEEKRPLIGLCEAYETVFYRSLARQAYAMDHGLLSRFNGFDQEQLHARLAELDGEIIQLSRERLAAFLGESPIPSGVGHGKKSTYSELALIKHEMNKHKRHLPIRQLFLRAKEALRILKPCLLMSPLSLAQYLPRDSLTFDLLVIDEASQMRPEEAIGAISRAKRIVIVGDPLQLPPTDFFHKTEEEDLEEEEAEETIHHESILDLALAVFPEICELRWHYRSQHESLIAFSNRHFYDNRLMIFPSSYIQRSDMGVKWMPVPGIYQSGVNPIEVQQLIKAVVDSMQHYPERSLGIVAVNSSQRDLLLEEFDYAIQHSPHAAAYMARWEGTLQAPFVKNLENVQGDERDTIFISLVYGPNAEGVVAQHFGPINRINGHRRLNVLFTRARLQLMVFSSLQPDQIKTEGKNPGVGILKSYLEYASTGRLETGRSMGEPESDFERCVAEKIRMMGCEVVSQVGVAGYRIDLGVRHPSYPYGYLLGVECDGATYHSSQTARMRDRFRQDILERLGWTIYRIWSTDWFRDPVTETRRLHHFIENLIKQKQR